MIIKGKSKRESAKAYLWTVNDDSSPLHGLDIWLPKSQVTLTPEGDALDCPAWLIAAKEDDAAGKPRFMKKARNRDRHNWARDDDESPISQLPDGEIPF
tara:strand:+ start:918 stop:1214 length:297 start_codon:yes stop_codon:yes gene_type:complete